MPPLSEFEESDLIVIENEEKNEVPEESHLTDTVEKLSIVQNDSQSES